MFVIELKVKHSSRSQSVQAAIAWMGLIGKGDQMSLHTYRCLFMPFIIVQKTAQLAINSLSTKRWPAHDSSFAKSTESVSANRIYQERLAAMTRDNPLKPIERTMNLSLSFPRVFRPLLNRSRIVKIKTIWLVWAEVLVRFRLIVNTFLRGLSMDTKANTFLRYQYSYRTERYSSIASGESTVLHDYWHAPSSSYIL